jgi:hypothetical protein
VAAALSLSFAFLSGGCSPVDDAPVYGSQNGGSAVYIKAGGGVPLVFDDYVYAGLTASEKAAYDALLTAVRGMESAVTFPEAVTPDAVLKIYKLVYTQESDIFWLDSVFSRPSAPTDSLQLSYRYDKERTETMKGELTLAANAVLEKIPPGGEPYDVLLYFHDAIIKNCVFSAESENCNSAYGALVDGKAQCEGYAFAFSLLCDKAGVENIVVTGKNAQGDTHAWNKVRLESGWYNVDCTWDDPVLKRESPDFVRYDYFFVPDDDILNITHFQDIEHFYPPICGDGELTYFKTEGLYFSSLQEGIDGLAARIRKQALTGLNEVSVRFSDKVYYEAALTKLFENNGLNEIIVSVNRVAGTNIKSAYKITNDNLRVIHLSLVYE